MALYMKNFLFVSCACAYVCVATCVCRVRVRCAPACLCICVRGSEVGRAGMYQCLPSWAYGTLTSVILDWVEIITSNFLPKLSMDIWSMCTPLGMNSGS